MAQGSSPEQRRRILTVFLTNYMAPPSATTSKAGAAASDELKVLALQLLLLPMLAHTFDKAPHTNNQVPSTHPRERKAASTGQGEGG